MEKNKETAHWNSPFSVRKIKLQGLKNALSIYSYTAPYRGTFILGFICLIVSTGTSLLFPKMIGYVVEVIEGNAEYTINQIIAVLFGLLVVQSVFSFFRIYLFAKVSEGAMADVRNDVYQKMITLRLPYLEDRRVGELTSRLTSDVSQLQSVLSSTLAEFFRQVATLVIGMIFIWMTSWKLSLFMLATFPVLVIAATFFGRFIRRLSRKAQDELAVANTIVEETLQSVQVVKAFTNEMLEIKRYNAAIANVLGNSMKAAVYRAGFVAFVTIALFGGIVGIIWYGSHLVQIGEMSIADLFTFTLYTAFIGGAMGGMGDVYAQINRAIGASERLLEIMEEPSEINPTTSDTQPSATSYHSEKSSISYNDVHFSYPSRNDVPVLKKLNLHIAPGEKIALVGQSGAGKSTIVQLLMRYYEPQAGEIILDGKPVQEYDLHILRKQIAIVPQEVMLFGGTIYENIAYGRPDAGREEIIIAAQKANALQFINSFPDQFETIVGERGVKLSGGQRQRIAIARAVLKNPRILILDEATSSLDTESEKLVQEALDDLMKDRTTIVIAHRLSTIRKVDCIYVIKNGQIAEAGQHDDLMKNKDGVYAGLVKLQHEGILS
jgi:ATP-binding cassette subfamily B protein